MTGYVLDLSETADLWLVGGKAANLQRLHRSGFDVPAGFVLTTAAYDAFVADSGLARVIADALAGADLADPVALRRASQRIRNAFGGPPLPAAATAELRSRITGLGPGTPVAVRSSATAEDLPELSFAGQQDTYLGVRGEGDILARIRDCWASLWTPRAIGYRAANGIGQDEISLAVIVQELVDADVSGVMFTANPLTGVRTETVVDATFGLGESLVSGQVEPDHYVIDSATGLVSSARIGAKAVVTVTDPAGESRTVASDRGAARALDDAALAELARLGQRVQAEYGSPQDVEWAIAGGRLQVLQARGITSLFDVPRAPREAPGRLPVWFSFGAFQGVLEPITPLGRDALFELAAGAGAMLGVRTTPATITVLGVAGERLWLRLDGVLRHRLGRWIVPQALKLADPASAGFVRELLTDPRLTPVPFRVSSLRPLARLGSEVVPRLVRTLAQPEQGRRDFEACAAALVTAARGRQLGADAVPDPAARLRARVEVARIGLRGGLRTLFPAFAPIMLPSLAMLAVLRFVAGRGRERGDVQLPLELLRGLAGNVTTEMDLSLWRVAEAIRDTGQPATMESAELTGFLQQFGMRGPGEIDLGRPRWREDPSGVLRTLHSYLQLPPERAPDRVFAQSVASADAAAARLAELSGLARPAVVGMIRRIRALLGARETPKFTIVSIMGMIREGLLTSGSEFAAAGVLERAEDVAFLQLDELHGDDRARWRGLVLQRRAANEREGRRRAVPRVICGDGRAYYGGPIGSPVTSGPGSADVIVGSAVSPGIVEGVARVVRDPHSGVLQAGEILVCVGTDPAWTPLFLAASGLVTEVGGMMTHGSVVAREYGIPAVVGVHDATSLLRSGTHLRLDGNSGQITILG